MTALLRARGRSLARLILAAGVVVVTAVPAGASTATRPDLPPTETAAISLGRISGRSVQECSPEMGILCPGLLELWSGGSSFLGIPVSCALAGGHQPTGSFATVPGISEPVGEGRVVTFRVEVEKGLAIHGGCFAETVQSIFDDPRGWGGKGKIFFGRVDDDSQDLRILLASPRTVNRLCLPLRTGGKLSCRRGNRAILNVWRWLNGTDSYGVDVVNYRRYLVNHEVGHYLGQGHASCPGSGRLAPVMMQQTKSIGSCETNPWPYPA